MASDESPEQVAMRLGLLPFECCCGSNPNCYGPNGCLLSAIGGVTAPETTFQRLKKERDEARAEVERLREELGVLGRDYNALFDSRDAALIVREEAIRARHAARFENVKLKQERDEARAEVERMRDILRDAMPILLEYGARGLGSRAAVALMEKEAGDG